MSPERDTAQRHLQKYMTEDAPEELTFSAPSRGIGCGRILADDARFFESAAAAAGSVQPGRELKIESTKRKMD